MATDFLRGVYNQASTAFPAVAYYTDAETQLYIDVRPGMVRLLIWHPSEIHVPLVRMETGFSESLTSWLPAAPQTSELYSSTHTNNTAQLVCTVLTLAYAAARTALPHRALEGPPGLLRTLVAYCNMPARCLDDCAWVYRAAVLSSWLAAQSSTDAARAFFLQELRRNTPSMHTAAVAADIRANPLAAAATYNNDYGAVPVGSAGQTAPLSEATVAEDDATRAMWTMLRTSNFSVGTTANRQRQRETYLSAQSIRADPAEIRAYLTMTAPDEMRTYQITPTEKSLEISVNAILLLVTTLTSEDLEKLLTALQSEQRHRAAMRQGTDHPGLRSLSKVRIPTGKQ